FPLIKDNAHTARRSRRPPAPRPTDTTCQLRHSTSSQQRIVAMLSGGRPTDLIQSVSRALRILEEVGESPGGLNVKQIARQCGIALPTTYHLVRTLTYEGYLVRRDNGNYTLGLAIASRFRDLLASME